MIVCPFCGSVPRDTGTMSDVASCPCFSTQVVKSGAGGWLRGSGIGVKINVDVFEPDIPHAWTGSRWEPADPGTVESYLLLSPVLLS